MENGPLVSGQVPAGIVGSLNQFAPVADAKAQEQISEELWKQANDEKDKLFALMEQVRARLDKKSAAGAIQPAKLDLRRCTWDQVMQEVRATAARWSSTPKRTSKMMGCLDKLGRNSDAFQTWLELLPGGDYGSSICGVFTLAIGAAGHYIKAEDAILEALVEIPEIIEGARRYIQIYSQLRDQQLERRTFDLYLSILKALTHIMRFFADSSFQKVSQSILKQSSYQSELLASLEDTRTQADRIKEEANQCMQRRLMDMDRSLMDQGSVLRNTNQISAQSLQILNNVYKLLSTMGLRTPNQGELDSNLCHLQPRPGNLMPKLEASVEMVQLQQLEATRARQKASEYSVADDSIQRTERAKELLQVLQFDPNLIPRDMETCLRLGGTLEESGKARAAGLVRRRAFRAYMTEASSRAPILVNGNEDLSCAEGPSPLTLVAARLAHFAGQAGDGLVLAYFCGEHRPYVDESPAASPAGMLASLLGQLVSQMLGRGVKIDLSFMTAAQWAGAKKLKFVTLCAVFQEVVGQLPPGSLLICILDEVGLFETGMLRRDTNSLFSKLTRLVRKHDKITFKLVVTCRGRALEIGQYFEGHVLEMDENPEADDSSAWQIASMVV